jgi:hypothetical protein
MTNITIKTEIWPAVQFIQDLGGKSKPFMRKILSAVGTKGVQAGRKGFKKTLKRRTGNLSKNIIKSLQMNKYMVAIYSRAFDPKNQKFRYGFILAHGSQSRNLPARDWLEPEISNFTQSNEFHSTVQKVLDKEIARINKK